MMNREALRILDNYMKRNFVHNDLFAIHYQYEFGW